ncbi:unnamed protein product [Parajaminaea phylloscopi]
MPPPPREPPAFSIPGGDEEDLDEKASTSANPPNPTTHNNRDPQLRLPPFTSITSHSRRKNEATEGDGGHGHGTDDEDVDDGVEAFFAAASTPQTPNISETAQQLRRSLSVHGLHQLSSMPPDQLRKSVSNKVWRPHDEQAKLPGDWERLAVHVLRGGMRAFNLAFGLRGTIMLVLALIKGIRKRKAVGKDLRDAFFSASNVRFGLLFGIWAALYKTVHNTLRLTTPMPRGLAKRPHRSQSVPGGSTTSQLDSQSHSPDNSGAENLASDNGHRGPPSGVQTPRSGYHQLAGKSDEERAKVKAQQKRRAFMKDPRSKVWHAYVAGAVSAFAVLVETKDNRISLAQQLFVRGAEGTYNVAHAKGLINIPHGAVLAFGLACGQIMYAWLNHPETLPKGYVNWITNASMVTPKATAVHRDIINGRPVDPEAIIKNWFNGQAPSPIGQTADGLMKYGNVAKNAGNRRGITAKNTTEIMAWLDRVKQGDAGAVVPCHIVHPWESSHWWGPLDRFVEVTRWILPVYLTLHFVPALFLRTGSFLKNPVRVILRSIFGSVRSSSFLGVFVIIFQTIFCAAHSLHGRIEQSEYLRSVTPKWFLDFLVGAKLHWMAGFLTCGSLFVDHARRRAELAAYVLPKGMESAWSLARRRGWAPFVPGGDLLLTSLGMSLVMGTYARSPEHLSGLVRRIVYQFIGRN